MLHKPEYARGLKTKDVKAISRFLGAGHNKIYEGNRKFTLLQNSSRKEVGNHKMELVFC